MSIQTLVVTSGQRSSLGSFSYVHASLLGQSFTGIIVLKKILTIVTIIITFVAGRISRGKRVICSGCRESAWKIRNVKSDVDMTMNPYRGSKRVTESTKSPENVIKLSDILVLLASLFDSNFILFKDEQESKPKSDGSISTVEAEWRI